MYKRKSTIDAKHIDILPVPKVYGKNDYKYERLKEEPISKVYPVIDTDLARDNIENDLTSADLQDLQKPTKA